ncbi:MAG TPA: WecB/TagA/CpsF family glycosyltransferase [Thermoanaerobaculia bacterium]|nr:WecB/TagA/CpsF family glycosyltransferase [Thermoanaerobaculia bacterium]
MGEWRPAPTDQLAALLLFYARDGFTDLRIAADIGAWWDAFGADLPRDALAAATDTYPALRHAIGSAALVAERLIGLPARQLLGARFRARRRDRLATRFANPHPEGTTPAQHFADRGLVDGLLTPRGGLRAFVDRQLLPSEAVLEQQADFLGRARARGRAARLLGTLGRYGVRLGSRTTGGHGEAGSAPLPLAVPVGERIRIMGMAVGPGAEGDVVTEIVDAVERGRGHWTVTANLDHLRRYNSEPLARELIATADLAIADGMPLVWASRIAGTPLPERITGSNLIPPLCRAAAERGLGVVMLGGDEGAGERAAAALCTRYPGLEVRDAICPPYGFEHDEEQMGAIEQRLASAAPGLVFVGLGFPKQDLVIRRLRAVVPGAAYIGIGNALSFFSGDVSRAPRWARDNGLEWLHRVIVEPRRRDLAQRYLVNGAPFALRTLGSAAAYRLDPERGDGRWGRWQPPRLELQPALPAAEAAETAEAA